MKGGVAAMIAAAGDLAPTWTRGRLIVAAVVDEEHMSLGAEALVREWRADMAIVTEPTDLRLAVGHKGFAWVDVVDARPRRARQPAGRGPRRDRAHGPRARRARGARPRTAGAAAGAVSGHRLAARVDHHTAAASSAAIRTRARCRWSGAPCGGEDAASSRRRWTRCLRGCGRGSGVPGARRASTAYRPAYCLDVDHALPRALGAALAQIGPSRRADRHVVLDRRGNPCRRRHSVSAVRARRRGPPQHQSST